jgi:branched-chain amino acid transport system ATP-binding protein/urea transport system ATP-binding protein
MLHVSGLRSGYGHIPILFGIDFNVAEGQTVGILGHNGMGKTTLLKTLMGYLPATAGSVRLGDADLTRLSPNARARRGIGYVPQGREIFTTLSVLENLKMGCLFVDDEAATIKATLRDFPRLEPLLDRQGGALSGGEQQILALARCLCGMPRIILLDEPTEGIQPSIVEALAETLVDLRGRRNLTIVLVEQNLRFITALAQRILLIQKGVITRELSAGEAADRALIEQFAGVD